MSDPSHLPCPACGTPSEEPLTSLVKQPTLQCVCGFRVTLPVHEIEAMLARIDRAKRLVRFSGGD